MIFHILLLVSFSVTTLASWHFGGLCDCPQFACQPPRPPTCPPAPCPPQPPCPGALPTLPQPNYYGVQSSNYQFPLPQTGQYQTTVFTSQASDPLEMRAAAAGIQLREPAQYDDQLKILETLGENVVEQDLDLVGLRKEGADIRRAPVINVKKAEEVTTLEKSSETEEKVSEDGAKSKAEPARCNSQVLRKLMEEKMTESSADSKHEINLAAEEKFGGNVDVICSRGHFSYVFASNLYCETTKKLVTCIAFRQAI